MRIGDEKQCGGRGRSGSRALPAYLPEKNRNEHDFGARCDALPERLTKAVTLRRTSPGQRLAQYSVAEVSIETWLVAAMSSANLLSATLR